MEPTELIKIIGREEDGRNQFKANINNENALAAEMVAFSNASGGRIFIGITNDGNIAGLTRADLGRLNTLVSNTASQSVRPPINPQTENVEMPDGLVMVVTIHPGISKPYMDNSGAIWVKSGADKRKVTSREEIQRMFQSSGLIHGDQIPANGLTVADLDLDYFREFFRKQYEEELEAQELPLPTILENMNLMNNGILNVAGALLFTKTPQLRLPVFIVKCVSYPGNNIHSSEYRDSEDIAGSLKDVFTRVMSFITRNIGRLQNGRNVNSLGELEIPKVTLEELVVNALIHRDYFVSAPIRIFLFDDRIEIISPGHLPNNLTVENIKSGNSNIRNPILTSFATKILPYRGLGNGIRRALKEYPNIDFEDERNANLFKVTIHRSINK
ncbi:MAG: putative DNA binding domain-containing protein [Clostridiales bacterium]|jgi:ATP-dependent DNA helicase RecG|nr:putative DNA binding domain-containing protein [Clostridiales bacterium]